MAKARMYGKVKNRPAMGQAAMDRMWQRKLQKSRNRERAPRSVVAGQIPKEKEAQP